MNTQGSLLMRQMTYVIVKKKCDPQWICELNQTNHRVHKNLQTKQKVMVNIGLIQNS